MWSRRTTSGTSDHPNRKDVFRLLLSKLIEKQQDSAWAHFEVVAAGGWFQNLLSGKQPWIEVAFANSQQLKLNPGVPKSKRDSMSKVPSKWQKNKALWIVPVADSQELIDWMEECLTSVCGKSDFQISGWLEGL